MGSGQRGTFWLALIAASLAGTRGGADEPRAAFSLKRGWVDVALRQDGQPVADADLQILDEQGMTFAQGQTDATGETGFPLPRGDSFVVEIKAGGRTADPIRLVRRGTTLEPGRVLLSYGLRPCCRFRARTEDVRPETTVETAPPVPGLLAIGTVVAVVIAGVAGVLLLLRRLGPGGT